MLGTIYLSFIRILWILSNCHFMILPLKYQKHLEEKGGGLTKEVLIIVLSYIFQCSVHYTRSDWKPI